MIISAGAVFNEEQWTIICLTIRKACVLSLHPLMQLMAAFYPYSQSFYGDLAQVKVAARRDSSVEENYRIKQLSQQVSGWLMITSAPNITVNHTSTMQTF